MSREGFGELLRRLQIEYDTQFVVCDFNARHPRWCMAHDSYKQGAELLSLTPELTQLLIYAPSTPTFVAVKNKTVGALRSSTVDLVLSRVHILSLIHIDGNAQICSDYHLIPLKSGSKIEINAAPRRISKTVLQSDRRKREFNTLYEVTLRVPLEKLKGTLVKIILEDMEDRADHIQSLSQKAKETISASWTRQSKRRRGACGPHANAELHRLCTRKKLICAHMCRHPMVANKLICK